MDDFKHMLFTVNYDDTVQYALEKIEANKYQSLIVIDEDSRVLGTLTDGDIRKALIANRSLLAPIYDVMNTHYQAVSPDNRLLAKTIFDKHFYINLIPVINDEGILQDIIQRDKMLST